MTYEELAERKAKRERYANEYSAANYDRITILVPKGDKNKITDFYKSKGFKSMAQYITKLIDADMTASGFISDFKKLSTFKIIARFFLLN